MRARPLRNTFWLAGSPCAGKSTVARRMAARFDWRIYQCDARFGEHARRASPTAHPALHRAVTLRADTLWEPPVREQASVLVQLCVEQFEFVLEDLAALRTRTARPILVEGITPLPGLVEPLLPDRNAAVWLISSHSFQRAHHLARPSVRRSLEGCGDPERAAEKWIARDHAFARWVTRRVDELGLARLCVDGAMDVHETEDAITGYFTGRAASLGPPG